MRIVFKNSKLCAQITHEVDDAAPAEGQTMGIDLGIKCPAVCFTESGKVKFVGNGRKNKYLKRKYRIRRYRLQKLKKIKAIKRIKHKENNVFKDIDHKLSTQIVKYAIANKVGIIKMEKFQNIYSTTRTSRKNNRNLHNWSFYRLANYIEYKAKLAGIKVLYVNPAYTSQSCPNCGKLNHAKDRNYICECGYHMHRDLVGAINICASTEYDGDRKTVSYTA